MYAGFFEIIKMNKRTDNKPLRYGEQNVPFIGIVLKL